MKFWNTVKKIERIRLYVTLFIVGLLFIAAACFAISVPKPEYASAEGTIQRLEPYTDTDGEDAVNVFISYTDNDGNLHENVRYPSYSSSMEVGNAVTVLYDPANPEDVHAPGAEFIPYIILIIGFFAIVISIVQIWAGITKNKNDSPFENTENPVDPSLAEQIWNDNSPKSDYYFHWTGKLNQSFVLETPERKAVFEAVCDHIGVLTPYRYTFTNHVTGESREHKISHTVTNRVGHGSDSVSFSVVSASEFKIDDVNNWTYLANLGYSVKPEQDGIKLNFDVLHHGVPVARLEAAGTNILKDSAGSLLGDKLPGTGLFKLSCKDSDLAGVFYACFCVSRVEFF